MRLRARHFLTVLLAAGLGPMTSAGSGDTKQRPAPVRTVEAESGRYSLELRGTAGWHSPKVEARLVERRDMTARTLWSKVLPQRLGPKAVIVGDDGYVVLFDEWVRTPSPLAIMILAPNGEMIAQYSFADVAKLAGVTRSALVKQAKLGAWMSNTPTLSQDGGTISVRAAGVELVIHPALGALRRASDLIGG